MEPLAGPAANAVETVAVVAAQAPVALRNVRRSMVFKVRLLLFAKFHQAFEMRFFSVRPVLAVFLFAGVR